MASGTSKIPLYQVKDGPDAVFCLEEPKMCKEIFFMYRSIEEKIILCRLPVGSLKILILKGFLSHKHSGVNLFCSQCL